METTSITVEGHFDYHHLAERGTVRLTAGFEGPDRAPVLTHTTALHAWLSQQAQQLMHAGVVTWWSADRLRVWSNRPWNQNGKQIPVVHHAAVALEVKFSDFSALADWVEKIGAEDGVTVSGIDWALTEATKSRISAEAQDRAVQDAVSRATSYARSLGLQTVQPAALADPGMLDGNVQPSTSQNFAQMTRGAAASGTAEGLDLKPEDITISARVHARFIAS